MGATSRNPSRRPARHGSGVGRCSAARGGPWLGHPSPVDDWYWLESGIGFYSPGGFVAIDHRHLDIHEDEVGLLRASTRNHKSLRRRPLTRRWWTFDLVHMNGSAVLL